MRKLIDLKNKRFGNLVVLRSVPKQTKTDKNGTTYWLCKCDCGKKCLVNGVSLRRGHSTSCGCKQGNIRHGKRQTRLYNIWGGMKQRCYNSNAKHYKNYGGRGIKVCDEWKNSFKNFYNWAINNGYEDGLTIDRTDTNKDYEPSNCRWVTVEIQNNNRRTNTYITYMGETLTLAEWATRLGYKYVTLHYRIFKLHWSIEDAFTKPVKKKEELIISSFYLILLHIVFDNTVL